MTVDEVEVVPLDTLECFQVEELCRWISATGELQLISGEQGTVLHPPVFREWLKAASSGEVLLHDGQVVGIAMLSSLEAPQLPADAVESCHLIIHPQFRRRRYGTALLKALYGEASTAGYRRVVGRVVNTNTAGRGLLQSLSWTRVNPNESSTLPNGHVVWFEKELPA